MITRGFQTLQEFINDPFRSGEKEKVVEYEKKYREFIASNKIKIVGYTKLDEDYYYHIVVPSSSLNTSYDVVIKFFAVDKAVLSQATLRSYYIQLFSNSPGFIYNYAALYKAKGYLIESLYSKMDPEYADQLPTKTNKEQKLSFDSSIYYACRVLTDNGARHLNKLGTFAIKKYNPDKFFSSIGSFQGTKISSYIAKEEKKLSSVEKSLINDSKRLRDSHRKIAGITSAKRVTGSSTTESKPTIRRVSKKSGSKKSARKTTAHR